MLLARINAGVIESQQLGFITLGGGFYIYMLSKIVGKSFSFLLASAISFAPVASAQDGNHLNNRNGIRHVLLISIDGMHAVDYANCVASKTCPNLAALG
ncbi:MAG TPA: hypothetical protein VGI46_05930, partial [Candidatus Acidoferrum sp.]